MLAINPHPQDQNPPPAYSRTKCEANREAHSKSKGLGILKLRVQMLTALFSAVITARSHKSAHAFLTAVGILACAMVIFGGSQNVDSGVTTLEFSLKRAKLDCRVFNRGPLISAATVTCDRGAELAHEHLIEYMGSDRKPFSRLQGLEAAHVLLEDYCPIPPQAVPNLGKLSEHWFFYYGYKSFLLEWVEMGCPTE